eukprot:TRINITY_DN71241_c0_g1_i1.p1 TRINITY_DN71241_c0_g1~~TRINITY_DN71241_c0_g1_i1.p1  ORF type:complete len:221 (-),score=28.60 TRINITY_DN71241_c0_g1_i1:61-681(-)
MPEPLRLQMRDSSGTPVSVELLHVRLEDTAQATYLIGIRELNNSQDEKPQALWRPALEIAAREIPPPRGSGNQAGTPASVLSSTLPEVEDSGSDSGTSTLQCLPEDPMVPRFHVTEASSILTSQMSLMLKWNIPRKPFCCSHHQLVHAAEKVLRKLKKRGCFDAASYIDTCSSFQCRHCGMIDDPILVNSKKSCRWCLEGCQSLSL